MAGADLSAMSGLAQASYIEATVAAVVIPAVWPIVAICYEGQSDPGQIWKAADGWRETIDELEKAQAKIEELSRRVPEDLWKGDDRTAFEGKMHDYVNQIDFAIVMAWAVAISLYVLAVMITAFIILMFVITGILAIFAAAICLAAGTIVGAPAALEMEVEANEFALGCLEVLDTASTVLTYACQGAAAVLTAFLGVDMVGQFFKGNKAVLANLGQATMNGSDEMLKGTLNYLEQKATAKLMTGEGITFRGTTYNLPEGARLPAKKGAASKGLIDVFTGGPTLSSLIPGQSYGTEDSDDNGRPDGDDYVDRTQPHR
jgi:putative Mn2+ efflux pump MntP